MMSKLWLRHQKFMKGNAGFSLVELIIVIAIMAALIAILAPQYIKYVEKSRVAADETTLSEFLTAVNVAVSDPENTAASVTVSTTYSNGVCTLSVPASTAATFGIYSDVAITLGGTGAENSTVTFDLKSSTYQGKATTAAPSVVVNVGAAPDFSTTVNPNWD